MIVNVHCIYSICTSKRRQQFVNFVRRNLTGQRATLLWFASGIVQEAQEYGIAVLYKTAHCGTAIKVRRTRWEKSGAHAATYSIATTARLLHSFLTYAVAPCMCDSVCELTGQREVT